jgi:uncharacterized membrane protein
MIALPRPLPLSGQIAVLAAAIVGWLASRDALILHLSSAVAALVLGAVIMLRAKGTQHRLLGRIWVAVMTLAALSSFWLTGLRDGFSVIHLLSVWTLVAMALAIYFIRKGKVAQHKRFMVGTFLGLAGAGIGALMPECSPSFLRLTGSCPPAT